MQFLTQSDFTSYMNEGLLNKVIMGNTARLSEAERMARGFIESNLGALYNLVAEFGRAGESRNLTLVRWMLCLSTYHVYNLVPDQEIPERVDKNYNDARDEIMRIAAGKGASDLTPLVVNGQRKTIFRWNASPRRSHNPF